MVTICGYLCLFHIKMLMALILNIETSTDICSVSIARDGVTMAHRDDNQEKSHASNLTRFIDDILSETSVGMNQLDAVSVSEGPGSYTGLRIGVSVAKGICYALDIPLIAISSLQAMTYAVIQETENAPVYLYCPMMDARRMEVYTALYDNTLKPLRQTYALVIDEQAFHDTLKDNKIKFFGNGADKGQHVIVSPNAVFIEGIECSALYMAELSNKAYIDKNFKDVAYFEPYYLKDFIATKPKRKIL
jgi:tRNA threonylcarbamoyladenosine biosynthesis protein TsaB